MSTTDDAERDALRLADIDGLGALIDPFAYLSEHEHDAFMSALRNSARDGARRILAAGYRRSTGATEAALRKLIDSAKETLSDTDIEAGAAWSAYVDADTDGDSRFTLDRDLLRHALEAANPAPQKDKS